MKTRMERLRKLSEKLRGFKDMTLSTIYDHLEAGLPISTIHGHPEEELARQPCLCH